MRKTLGICTSMGLFASVDAARAAKQYVTNLIRERMALVSA